jgi:hypothetical protein
LWKTSSHPFVSKIRIHSDCCSRFQQIFDRLRNLNNSEDVYKELYEPDRPSEEGKRPSEEGKRSGKSGKSEKRSRKGAPKSKLTKSSAQSAKRSSRKGGMDSGEGGGGDGDGGGSGGDGDRDSDDGRFEPDGFDFTDCDSFSNAWYVTTIFSVYVIERCLYMFFYAHIFISLWWMTKGYTNC